MRAHMMQILYRPKVRELEVERCVLVHVIIASFCNNCSLFLEWVEFLSTCFFHCNVCVFFL